MEIININPTIIPMEVTDVVDNLYILQSLDHTRQYKLPCGLVEMTNGALICIDENTYIKLIIHEESEEVTLVTNASTVEVENIEVEDRHAWQYDETISFIESMSVHLDDLNHAKKRKHIYENVANDLLSSGFSITAIACQNKWKNLLRSYKACKDNKNKTGRGPTRFQFFEKMDELLGEKPSNKCSHALESNSNLNIEDFGEAFSSTKKHKHNNHTEEIPKKIRKHNTSATDFIDMKRAEYVRRQKRHEENVALQKRKLDLGQEKIDILKKLLEK